MRLEDERRSYRETGRALSQVPGREVRPSKEGNTVKIKKIAKIVKVAKTAKKIMEGGKR